MAKVEDCPGFETFGADVKAARKARHLARKALAEMVGIEWRYREANHHQHDSAVQHGGLHNKVIGLCAVDLQGA